MAFNQRIGRAVLELSIDGGAFVRGAQDAKANIRSIAKGIADVQRDILKRTFKLSGRDQIAEATKLTEAIRRIGGVVKLTAQERAQAHTVLSGAMEKSRLTQ